ncbi:MAG: LysM motif protein, partial [Proteobacteria bacterium]|nr:LysM motif protein [Pseudomonadota bacterium]
LLVARKADFREVILETLLPTNEIVLPELDNGAYFLKVRGIDDLGLEGKDTLADLVLNLEPAK